MIEQESSLRSILRKRDVLSILVLAMLVIAIWIGYSAYQAWNKTTIEPVIAKQTAPLNPTINREVLDGLKSRRFFTQEELQNFQPSVEILDENGQPIRQGASPTTAPRVSTTSGSPTQSSPTPTATPDVPAEPGV